MAYFINSIWKWFYGRPQTLEATNSRDFDRSFILFGKGNSGKSTLTNLLLGRPEFKVHMRPDSFGLTKCVQFADTKLDPERIYGEGCALREPLKVQMLDQPGSNDSDFREEDYCNFLLKCIANSKGEMCGNFLILINLISCYLSPEEFLTIMNISEVLSKSGYSFFPNATIVFTHADKIDINLNKEKLEKELREKIKEEKFAYIEELIKLVEERYIFINGTNDTEENRYSILRKLFKLTRLNLDVYVNGYEGFGGNKFKMLIGADPNAIDYSKTFPKYDVKYHFNLDLNLFRRYDDTLDIGQEITQALNRLSGISKGVSVIILLVSLEEIFHQEIYNLFLNLPETYRLGTEFKKDFWNYTCILFKVPSDDKSHLERNLEKNLLLKEFVRRVNWRYDSISPQTSRENCSEKTLALIKKVKLDTEGKTYLDTTVLVEMRSIIDESIKERIRWDEKIISQMTEGITNQSVLRAGIPLFKADRGPKVIIHANNFFWNRKWISPQIGYFIMKNMNPPKAKDFQEKFKDHEKITNEEFAEFCIKVMKEM